MESNSWNPDETWGPLPPPSPPPPPPPTCPPTTDEYLAEYARLNVVASNAEHMTADRQKENEWLAAELECIHGSSDELISQQQENERLTAELNRLQKCRRTPIQSASQAQPPMGSSIDASLAYIHHQQLK
ncbi:hypothetical protein K440DRAFT_644060 [Wilcoxina mikolae CBS 423.85]|nr:hypothetical protein K440DRAFT_644060 [Wilcoxina mikolae CBS 423.85]